MSRHPVDWHSVGMALAAREKEPPMAVKLTARQAELLAAVGRGEVAHRYHLRCGWAARWHLLHGKPVSSGGRGGGMGRNVDAATLTLVERGLIIRQEGPRPYADHPYVLTDAGREALGANGGDHAG